MHFPPDYFRTTAPPRRITGSEMIWDACVTEGVSLLFGHPGGAILPAYDALAIYEAEGLLHHVLVRHEQCAAHMADGYARATGEVGVCVATSGPGATNLVTGIATAQMDSVPNRVHHGPGAFRRCWAPTPFQEADIVGVTQARLQAQLPCHRRGRPADGHEGGRFTLPGRVVPVRCSWTCARTCRSRRASFATTWR